MKYTLENGKTVNIPDAEIEKNMKILELSKEEAIEMWLEDEGYLDNEEQIELQEKASKVRINLGASAIDKTEKKEKKDSRHALWCQFCFSHYSLHPVFCFLGSDGFYKRRQS